MSSLLPLASYNLALNPFVPTQAIESDLPVTVHITLAALDPSAVDDDEEPSTLKILKSSVFNSMDSEDEDEETGESESEDEDSEDEDYEHRKIKSKGDDDEEIKDAESDDEDHDSDEDHSCCSEDDDESDDEGDDDVEEFVVCTLSPKSQYQQTLNLTITPGEDIYFVVTGSYPIHISGNYVEHPYDNEDDDYSYDEDSDDYSDEHDLTPDEDELSECGYDLDDLEGGDVEAKIEELIDEEEEEKEQKQSSKKNKATKAEKIKEVKAKEEEEEEEETKEVEKPKLSKKEAKRQRKEAAAKRKAEEESQSKPEAKKQKQDDSEKNVQFNKELEQGPSPSTPKTKSKPTTKTLAGGIVVEDRTVGKGPTAKNGSKVGVRYIGKLKNGSIFDKNTSGKPFNFNLGKGEVIKGWDIGVSGMAVGGERRIIIPAPFAYGKKKLPGIPANSELTFDVKLVSLK